MATPARRGHGEGSIYRDAANSPVITTGADVMDKIFTASQREG